MGQFELEDPKLAEVKAILSRLQRMSPDDEPIAPKLPMPRKEMPKPVARTAAIETPTFVPRPVPDEQPAFQPQPARLPSYNDSETSLIRIGTALAAGCSGAALVLFLSRSMWLPSPVAQPEPPAKPVIAAVTPKPSAAATEIVPEPVKAAPVMPPPALAPAAAPAVTLPRVDVQTIQQAQNLIQRGELNAGRTALLALSPDTTVEVAWALARSYDPNVVGAIASADSPADADQAVRWYRQWHVLAIQQGLVADSISVDRIIRSMPR